MVVVVVVVVVVVADVPRRGRGGYSVGAGPCQHHPV